MAEEAYVVMKDLQNKQRDEFDAYGETVAMTLRKLSKISATYTKFEINKILFAAEMGHYEQPARPVSTISYSSDYSNTSAVVPTPKQSPLDNSNFVSPVSAPGQPSPGEYLSRQECERPYINNTQESQAAQSVVDDNDTDIGRLLNL